ncbi:tyrosine phosphatase family protein [Bradyrhizobium lablabi]|uniref:tyrosine phosphatase family protein n=1 Tax=Bradyrhizobium lablabi TaxID=722472 RepID=UPI001BA5582E|nr:protein tyrosine phosphatase [Bradyrhizobium lablabi]MBR0698165.1 protein tyrosine phosphatase [Bradyrhizobium lablabi]
MSERSSRDISGVIVCPLSQLAQLARGAGPFALLSLFSPGHERFDCSAFDCRRQLDLSFHDIVEPRPGLVPPNAEIVRSIIDFGRNVGEARVIVNCFAGISRSSAAAYILACDRNPGLEREIAEELRRRSVSATPNRLMISIADGLLGRGGDMVEAIARIGRGADAFEGTPFVLPLNWPSVSTPRAPAGS